MASNELKARVSLDTSGAERKLDSLIKKINQVNAAVQKTASASTINAKVNNTKQLAAVDKYKQKEKQAAKEVEKAWEEVARRRLNSVEKIGNALRTTIGRAIGIAGSIALGKSIVNTSDLITSAENKLNYLNGGNAAATSESMDKMYAAALRSRSDYGAMMSNVSKSMALAGDKAFKGNIDNAIRFQEIMAKSYTLGGASAAEQASSMYQMVQALGSGKLAGDELRSVREGAPLAYAEIEKFAQKTLQSEESLKDLAAQGKITSDIVVAAMLEAGDSIDEAFKDTDMTFTQAFTNLKSVVINSFRPIQDTLNELLNSEAIIGLLNGIAVAIQVVMAVVNEFFKAVSVVINWIADNWNWLKIIFIAGAILMGIYLAQLIWSLTLVGAKALIAGVKMFVSWLLALGPIGLVIAAVLFLAALFVMFTEQIVGALWWLGALFKNIGLWIANLAIGIWEWVTTIVSNIAEWISTAASNTAAWVVAAVNNVVIFFKKGIAGIGAFFGWLGGVIMNSISVAVNFCVEKFWSFVGTVRSAILSIANFINKVLGIFGIEIDTSGLEAGVEAARAKADAAKNKKEESQKWLATETLSKAWSDATSQYSYVTPEYISGTYSDPSAAFSAGYNTYDAFQDNWASDAYAAGAEVGANLHDKMTGWISGVGEELGITGTPDVNDPATALNTDDYGQIANDIANGTDDTAKNTGRMADSMDLADEDLAYLRDLAEMEWKKEFTTANITVDMSNYNTINGDGDLDGIVTKLADKLYEELDYVAGGTYGYSIG